ncbi:hypothetical protein KKI17_02535 [Patescibacteria group bacterium]|nr:hypothetical protein [Patescibacteria group bacterium]
MIQGGFRGDGIPVVPLIVGWKSGVQEIIAMLDTGFSGELKVPPEVKKELGLVTTHIQPTLLANNQIEQSEAALAYASLEGATEEVTVLITPGFPAIGSGLLRRLNFALAINFRKNIVTLEKLGDS